MIEIVIILVMAVTIFALMIVIALMDDQITMLKEKVVYLGNRRMRLSDKETEKRIVGWKSESTKGSSHAYDYTPLRGVYDMEEE